MTHVLHVRVVSGAGGGPEKTILRSPRFVDPRKYAMTCAYLHRQHDPGFGAIRAAAGRLGVNLLSVPERHPLDPRVMRVLLDACRRRGVTIWHGHDYKSNLLGLLLRRRHPMKLVTTVHGWVHYTAKTRLYYTVEKRLLRRYDHVVTVSDDLRGVCVGHGVEAGRISVVPNAIDCDEYRPRLGRDAARLHAGIGADETAIGFVGRLSDEKRVDEAIRIVAKLAPAWPKLRLHVVGEGAQRGALEGLAAALGVRDRVVFHGWLTDPRAFYEALDLFLLPSRREGTPNALLEAMSMGAPIAATGIGGVGALLDRGRHGVLLDAHDTRHWAQAVDRVLRQPPDTQAARRWIEQRYSFAARMRRITEIYDRLPGSGGEGPVRIGARADTARERADEVRAAA